MEIPARNTRSFGKTRRPTPPVMADTKDNKLREVIRRSMEIPDVIIETKDSEQHAAIGNSELSNDSKYVGNASTIVDKASKITNHANKRVDTASKIVDKQEPRKTTTNGPSSPRFVVKPVSAMANSGAESPRRDEGTCTGETESKSSHEGTCAGETKTNSLPEGTCAGETECKSSPEGTCVGETESKSSPDPGNTQSRKYPVFTLEDESDDQENVQEETRGSNEPMKKVSDSQLQEGQTKDRKVSFYDELHPGEQQQQLPPSHPHVDAPHPGYLYTPRAHNQRKVSGESFYSYDQAPSRKSSLDAFYYPQHPQPLHVLQPHHKISVFSVQSSISDTEKTFHDSHEALPHADHYRDLASVFDVRQRPTLYQLREEDKLSEPLSPTSVRSDLFSDDLYDDVDADDKTKTHPATYEGPKFGWIQGVLVRCLLNIFGVMLFLRLTWITGQAGVGLATVIIALSALVTIITTMSMSAICTNGEVKGGGAYYMISRSLGPEFGGSIGIVFSLANAIAAAMYIVGFAETIRDLLWENDAYITGNALHEVRIIGVVTCFICLGVVLIGMEWEAKAQLGLLVVLLVAIVNFFVGTFIPPTDEKKWKGVLGYRGDTFTANFVPGFTDGNNFFSVFSIFFPAATGILAGANISGDLKDPQKAIPKGTFIAIFVTAAIYIAMVWAVGGCILRDALGPSLAGVIVDGATGETLVPTADVVGNCSDAAGDTCGYGLNNDNTVVGIASAWRPLILAGIFSATLSSALASMVGAPKVFQALGKDKLFPYIHYFSKGFGKNGEPRRAYILTFIICLAMTCVGSLDLIAPIISNFFLMAYALINYSCFDASVADTPGFRPAFRYYSKWASLVGALLCLAVMFLINWWAALVTFVIVGTLYMYIKITKPDVNWGSSTQAHAYREALKTSLKLVSVDEHVKNFRPQILALTGYPRNRSALVDLAAGITKRQSLLICGHIFQGELSEHIKRLRSTSAYRWFKTRHVKAFYNCVAAPTFRIGVQVLLQALGLGKMRPNTLFIGYKDDWAKADPRDVLDYYNVIQDAFDMNYGVGVLRLAEGLDRNKVPDELLDLDDPDILDSDDDTDSSGEGNVDSKFPESVNEIADTRKAELPDKPLPTPQRKTAASYTAVGGRAILKRLNTLDEGLENLAYMEDQPSPPETGPAKPQLSPTGDRFRQPAYGTIDVWWLYDDGGLTLLVPYIMSQRHQWKNCKLRVFCVGTKKGNIGEDQMRMAALLSKFRIDYSQLTVISELSKKPQLSTYKQFESLIHRWRLRTGEYQEDYVWKIADADLVAHKPKTYRHLRLREELIEHSKDASLIVMTLPMPRRSLCPAGLYMGWLEILSRDMPPMLLLRGNQQSVLTYYS